MDHSQLLAPRGESKGRGERSRARGRDRRPLEKRRALPALGGTDPLGPAFCFVFKTIVSFARTFELHQLGGAGRRGWARGAKKDFFSSSPASSSENCWSWHGVTWKKAATFPTRYKITPPPCTPAVWFWGGGIDKTTVDKSSVVSALDSCCRDGHFSWCRGSARFDPPCRILLFKFLDQILEAPLPRPHPFFGCFWFRAFLALLETQLQNETPSPVRNLLEQHSRTTRQGIAGSLWGLGFPSGAPSPSPNWGFGGWQTTEVPGLWDMLGPGQELQRSRLVCFGV